MVTGVQRKNHRLVSLGGEPKAARVSTLVLRCNYALMPAPPCSEGSDNIRPLLRQQRDTAMQVGESTCSRPAASPPSASFRGRNSCQRDTRAAKPHRWRGATVVAFPGVLEKEGWSWRWEGRRGDKRTKWQLRDTCRSCSLCNILIEGGGEEKKQQHKQNVQTPGRAGERTPCLV